MAWPNRVVNIKEPDMTNITSRTKRQGSSKSTIIYPSKINGAQEKGTSAIDEHGFALRKSAFREALSGTAGHYKIRHHTVLVATYSALNMHWPDFPAIRHWGAWYHKFLALRSLPWSDNWATSPAVLRRILSHNSAITDKGPRLDVPMNDIWGGQFEKAILDVRVFNSCPIKSPESTHIHIEATWAGERTAI